MKNISYIKVNGAGNEFILIDEKENPSVELNKTEIEKICNRETGLAADGVIILKDDENSDFKMQYYNADGSTGSLCGNGARCAIKYAEMTKRVKSKTTVFTSNGQEYHGEILTENSIKFFFKEPTKIKIGFRVKSNDQLIKANFANTGSPHVVVNIEDVLENSKNLHSFYTDLESFPVAEIGQEIRNLPEFQPLGTNANFIQPENEYIKIRSFERGVEAETMACGTGAVAAAIISNIIFKKNPPIKIITKSNAELIVNFEKKNQRFTNLSLTGPVEIEHKGNYSF